MRTNVPTTLSSFVGRSSEIEQLARALAAHRLVTVVGPGGVGKTRLVREVAASIAGSDRSALHPDGVWWVELAPVRSGAEVAAAVAGVLAVHPTAGRRLNVALADALRGQRLLLVLDNCEHLLMETAQLVDALLRAAPGLGVLCTTREALSIEGEVTWPIRALPHPAAGTATTAAEIGSFEAVQLFVERARAVTPGFALTDDNAASVGTVCARLDGLPLALELAAAVVPVLGIDGLASRIDDALTLLSRGRRTALPRHRTLRAVLDWSYTLLAEEERTLLRRLSVFRGSFPLDAIEEVCAPDGSAADLVSTLGRLVEHSLVEVREEEGESRYRLLETVRQFGTSLLRGTPEEGEVRGRHARWVGHLAADAEAGLFGPARGRTVERLRRSIDEIRAALAWATRPGGSPELAVEIGGALGWFWISGLPWDEARRQVDAILAVADAQRIEDGERPIEDRLALGKLLYPLKGLSFFVGDTETMLRTSERELPLWASVLASPALSAAQRLAAERGLGLALQLDGIARAMRGDADRAVESMDRCIEVAARSGDPWILAVLTIRRALVHFILGDHVAAAADYGAAIPALRDQGELWFLSLAHEGSAMAALARGDVAGAVRDARESVSVLRAEPDGWFISRGLDTLAFVMTEQGGSDRALEMAARLIGAADALRERCGAGVIGPDLERNAMMARVLRVRLGDDAYAGAHAAGSQLSLADVLALVDSDPTIGAMASKPGPRGPSDVPRTVATIGRGRLELRALGPFALARAGIPRDPATTPTGKVRELLLFLLLSERATKDEVGLALWPDASAAQVRNAFHVTLHHLRRQLGPEPWVVFEEGRYRLDRNPAGGGVLEADVDALLAASSGARRALRRRERVDADTIEAARRVFESSTGDLAPGMADAEWLVAAQARVRAAWCDGLDALAQICRRQGLRDEAIDLCALLVEREPLREGAHRLIMEALAERGEVARALAHYEGFVGILRRELGTRPSMETRALADRLGG